jgi:flagellar motility protein MotE (MotC chaperone)
VKVVVAILLIAAAPVCAQAQSAPKVNKGDAQKVVTIISGDQAKTQAYCDIQELADQIEEANKKKDGKKMRELSQKIETLEKTLGPEFAALIEGSQDIMKDKQLDEEFVSAIAALDRLCAK